MLSVIWAALCRRFPPRHLVVRIVPWFPSPASRYFPLSTCQPLAALGILSVPATPLPASSYASTHAPPYKQVLIGLDADAGSLTCCGGCYLARAVRGMSVTWHGQRCREQLTEQVSRFSGVLASLSVLLSLIVTLTSHLDGEEGGMGSGARRCSLNGIT
jgi:hypothetical protein